MWTSARLGPLSEWLLLSPNPAAALKSGEGFAELARFDAAASSTATR
jgi:hypothetical protein